MEWVWSRFLLLCLSHHWQTLNILTQTRGQVFAAISYTDESHELLKTSIELRRQLNEMLLQGAIMDLKENGQFNGWFTFPDPDPDSYSDSDCKPNGCIVLCRTFHTAESVSDSNPNCWVQEWYCNRDRNRNLHLWTFKNNFGEGG